MPRDVISPTSSGLKAQTGKLTASLTNAITRKLTGAELEQLFLEKFKLTLSDTELVTNGTFDTDTDWTKQTGWSIGSGVASCDGSQTGAAQIYQTIPTVTVGKQYQVTYDLTITAGSMDARMQGGGGSTVGAARTTSGSYTDILVPTLAHTTIRIRGTSDFVGTVDNVSVKEVTKQAPVAAFSLRKLGNVSPYACRIRRSYDNTEAQVFFDASDRVSEASVVRNTSQNLFSNSEDFVNAWGNAAVATSNTHPNPIEGAMTADTVGSNGGVKHRTISATLPQTGSYTYSIYLKRKTGTGAIRIGDFTDGTNEVAVTSEWQRFSRTAYLAAGTHTFTLRIDTTNDEVYAWGAMLQQTVYESTPSGSELIANGNFDDTSAWTQLGDASIGSGVATIDGTSQTSHIVQAPLTEGRKYVVTFDVSSDNGTGNRWITNNLGGSGLYYNITGNGSQSVTFTHTNSNGNLFFTARNGGYFVIDNISVRELLPEVSEYISTPVVSNDGLTFTETTLDDFVGGENKLSYSEDFSYYSNDSNYLTVENLTGTTPIGTSYSRLTVNTSASAEKNLYLNQNFTITAGETYIGSVYVRNNSIIDSSDGENRAQLWLQRNGVGTYEGTGVTIPVSSEWQRVSVSHTFANNQTGLRAKVVGLTDADQGSIEVTGFQVNTDSLKTYQKTTGTAREGNAGIVVLYNQTGGEDIIQDTQARQPLLYKQGLLVKSGSSPALAFDGTDDSLIFSDDDFSDTLNLNSLSSFVVFKSDDDNQSGWVLALGTNTGTKRWYAPNMQGGNFQFSYGSSSGTAQSTDDTNAHLASAVAGASNGYKAYLDGVEKGSTSVQNNSNDTDPAFIGAISQGSLHFEGKIYELIIFDTDQSTNRVSIEKDINDFHNLF